MKINCDICEVINNICEVINKKSSMIIIEILFTISIVILMAIAIGEIVKDIKGVLNYKQ